jgi:hypothetical protein
MRKGGAFRSLFRYDRAIWIALTPSGRHSAFLHMQAEEWAKFDQICDLSYLMEL